MGLPLGEASTGGGSDGSFTAALGVPTLDGLGAVGDGAHSPREHVVIQQVAGTRGADCGVAGDVCESVCSGALQSDTSLLPQHG